MTTSSTRLVRTIGVIALGALLGACRHGILITGQGSVSSATGTRDCASGECRFDIEGRYLETYTATPKAGWLFDAWENCQTPQGNRCSFDIAADVVAEQEGAEVPSAVARFRRPIEPLFRDVNGNFELPDGSATNQLRWLLEELGSASTSLSEIKAHFHPDFLAQIPAATMRDEIAAMRAEISDPVIDDLITATPVYTRGLIAQRGRVDNAMFLSLNADYGNGSDDGLITSLSWTPGLFTNGNNVTAEFANANLASLGQSVKGLATKTAMLVARIENDRCKGMYGHNAQLPYPTGSIFKLWVLGALAEEIRAGRIDASAMVPMSSAEYAPGSAINNVTPGTQIPLAQMANLMLGVSDNTATDHIHELIPRPRLEKILGRFKNKNKSSLTPFLSVNEQFHILWSLTPARARAYANRNDNQQRKILANEIEPLGPVSRYSYNNWNALLESSWAASAFDVCQAYAGLRSYDNRSEAFELLDQAAGADAVLLSLRKRWDRVWQKGGSLATVDGNFVFTLSWLLESDDKGTYVVVIMLNNPDLSPVDFGPAFNIAARAEQILYNR
ncbi:serine hydrolase [Parahaliea mediterranea]|uniref:serine hydrolase n=1 Tax=Parahaliea mediterranea TaxID=651086 RepID=UPI000E2F852C|nr:serine hydrolase [Parahaliea mediterranea]